jgi:hypothetical protein
MKIIFSVALLHGFVISINRFTVSMPLYHIEHKVSETWCQPEIAQHVETALSLRSKINTLADRNTWELSGTITAPENVHNSLSVRYVCNNKL